MLSFAGKFLLTLIVTNWIYSEISIFLPGFQDFSAKMVETVRIPTHDEWPDIFNSNKAAALSIELDSMISSSSLNQFFPFSNPDAGSVSLALNGETKTYQNFLYTDFIARENSSFFTGENLFSRRDFGPYRYFR